MSWISGNCQGNKRYECYYVSFEPTGVDENGFPTYAQWCLDSDNPCFAINDGGGLVKVVDHQAGGGGW